MSDHLQRIRKYMSFERKALLHQARRAKLFDNSTNRGSEAEHSIRRWLSARFAPEYTVSSSEIIDSFDTNADLKSRQQDGILHSNSAEANRFILPSGMRLVPIETVPVVVEVKLTLTKKEFDRASKAADDTARLRLRGLGLPTLPGENHGRIVSGVSEVDPHMTEEQFATGISQTERRFKRPPVTYALFAFLGRDRLETIRGWMNGKTISVVCCLETGCVVRDSEHAVEDATIEADANESLWHFSEALLRATEYHSYTHFRRDFSGYAPYKKNLVSVVR